MKAANPNIQFSIKTSINRCKFKEPTSLETFIGWLYSQMACEEAIQEAVKGHNPRKDRI
jgi:23S rRNA maturation mini-RNase III